MLDNEYFAPKDLSPMDAQDAISHILNGCHTQLACLIMNEEIQNPSAMLFLMQMNLEMIQGLLPMVRDRK